MSKAYVGIDFGAENIVITYSLGDNPQRNILRINNEERTKNCLAINKAGQVIFGKDAINLYNEDPKTVFYERYKKNLIEKPHIKQEEAQHTPAQVMEEFFKEIYKATLDTLNEGKPTGDAPYEIGHTVVTVPVGWDKNNQIRGLYKEALDKAGFKRVSLYTEPVAAAAHVITALDGEVKENILVMDMGSSTLDISLCHAFKPISVTANDRTYEAGNHFDLLLAKEALGISVPEIEGHPDKVDILAEAKAVKENIVSRKLSKQRYHILDQPLNKTHFEAAYTSLLSSTSTAISEFLSAHSVEKIDQVLFCGGMSGLRYERYFAHHVYDVLKNEHVDIFSKAIFLNGAQEFAHRLNDRFLNYAISYGASLLARDPDLVLEKLEYSIGVDLKFHDDKVETFEVIPKKTPMHAARSPISLLSVVQRTKPVACMMFSEGSDPFLLYFDRQQPGAERVVKHVYFDRPEDAEEHWDWEKAFGATHLDVFFSLDGDGVLLIEVKTLEGDLITQVTIRHEFETN